MGEVQGSTKLLQDDAPDATFSSAGSRKGQNKGIVSILTMLKEDLQDEIKNAAKEEAATHAKFDAEDYKDFKTQDEEYLSEIKPDCDWMLVNFDARKEARAQEMQGLVEAEALLEGAVPGEMPTGL